MSNRRPRLLTAQQVARHNIPTDCWLVIDGQVWDLTAFAPEHPGGAAIILRYAGRDATKAYNEVHQPSVLADNLPPDRFKGTLDDSTVDEQWLKPPPEVTQEVVLNHERPPLETLINAHDFEVVASKTAPEKTWAFYSSAATDLITRDANKSFFDRIWFRPRVMRNVWRNDTRTRILGCDTSAPFFVSPAAMVKLIHPDGELVMAKGCRQKGILQCISTSASYPLSAITSGTEAESSTDPATSYPFFFQLYVNKDRVKAANLLAQCNGNPHVRAIFITVDAAWPGKREADERVRVAQGTASGISNVAATNDKKGGGIGRTMSAFIDSGLNWSDITWLRKSTSLPLVLKGVMSADDVKRAADIGLAGVVLSNHGGRNLDTSPPAILILLECQKRFPEVFEKLEILLDGGVRRGTDILKALCLGATAVGLGRSFLFAANYGQDGIEHLIDIIQDELETAMRLIGINDLFQVSPEYVNTGDLDHMVPDGPGHPYAKARAKNRVSNAFKAKL